MNKTYNCVAMVGLPASGKTEYAKITYPGYRIIDCDEYMLIGGSLDELLKEAKDINLSESIVLDGLFLTDAIQKKITNTFSGCLFVYFSPNKMNSLYNDSMRGRDKTARLTIQNAKIDKPHRCYTVPTLKFDYIQHIINENDLLEKYDSKHISLGGTYGTCYDEDGPTEIQPDYEELDIKLFGDFINIIDFFNASDYFDELTKIVIEDSDSETDYYGGCEEFKFLTFNTRELIEEILRLKYNITCFDTKDVMQNYPELFV